MARWDLMLNYTRGTPALSKNTMFQDFWPPVSNLICIWLLIDIWLSFSINYVFIFLSYFWTPQWILLSTVHLTILFAFSQKMLLSCCQYEYIYTFLSVVSSPLSHLFLIVPHSVCTLPTVGSFPPTFSLARIFHLPRLSEDGNWPPSVVRGTASGCFSIFGPSVCRQKCRQGCLPSI